MGNNGQPTGIKSQNQSQQKNSQMISRGKNMKFILIKTNLDFQIVNIDRYNFLQKCYELIGCCCIEVCVPRPLSGCLRYVVDDCGKLNDQHFNLLASVFYDRDDPIFGNVILGVCGVNEYGEQDICGLTDEQCKLLCNILSSIKASLIY